MYPFTEVKLQCIHCELKQITLNTRSSLISTSLRHAQFQIQSDKLSCIYVYNSNTLQLIKCQLNYFYSSEQESVEVLLQLDHCFWSHRLLQQTHRLQCKRKTISESFPISELSLSEAFYLANYSMQNMIKSANSIIENRRPMD